jgi:ATP-dependent DNA helicase DinG
MARVRALEERGLDGFEHYMVPAATVRLKQGFGRLIRSGSDRGLMALLDGRAASTRYGATILSALPPALRVEHLDDLESFFREEDAS